MPRGLACKHGELRARPGEPDRRAPVRRAFGARWQGLPGVTDVHCARGIRV
jgi:hypothetical protein